MAFRMVFISIFIGTALIVAALLLNRSRPYVGSSEYGRERGPQFVRATGKCAECHSRETSAIVHMYEMSMHASKGVTCLDCHQPVDGQEPMAHSGFTLATEMTSLNCFQCHQNEYEEFLRSRHAAPAFAAVAGAKDSPKSKLKPRRSTTRAQFVDLRTRLPFARAKACLISVASPATTSVSRTPTAASAHAHNAIPATQRRWRWLGNRRLAVNVTWVRTTRSLKSSTNRNTEFYGPTRRAG